MELLHAIVIAIPLFHFTVYTHADLNQSVGLCGTHSAATLEKDGNEQLTPATHFCIRKIAPYKSPKYLNVLEKYLESKYFGNVLEYKYKYSGFLRNVLKYIPSTLPIVLKYRCT